MKYLVTLFLASLTLISVAQLPVISIGDKLPAATEKLKSATDGSLVELKSLKAENGLLVIFSCNTCPFVVAWEDRYPVVNKIAKENNVGFVLINSNYMKRSGDDSWEAMKNHSKAKNYRWPYLIDDESNVANAFGAQTTPHVFLFDKNLTLVYKGAIDDNHKDASQVKDFYLKEALLSLGAGKDIALKETRNLGCGIKRKTE